MTKHMNDIRRGEIQQAVRCGMTPLDIAAMFNIKRRNIYKILKRLEDRGNLARSAGSGRKRCTTDHDDRQILRMVGANRRVCSADILRKTGLLNVSQRTINRRVIESGEFFSTWTRKAPFVSPANLVKRLQWCRDHENWTTEMWRNVIWLDESPYVLRFNRKVRVYKRPGEVGNPALLTGTVKHDRKIMVWGCFSAQGLGNFHRIHGIMFKENYNIILEEQVMPSIELLAPHGHYIFQQDNDPKHTAIINRAWFEDNGVPLLPWPAQSPDLNPIENLWSILDLKLKERRPQIEEQLFEALRVGWEALDIPLLERLSDSMPDRIAAVIANKGYPCKY